MNKILITVIFIMNIKIASTCTYYDLCKKIQRKEIKIIFVDFDQTITYGGHPNDKKYDAPIQKTVKLLRFAKKYGTIIIVISGCTFTEKEEIERNITEWSFDPVGTMKRIGNFCIKHQIPIDSAFAGPTAKGVDCWQFYIEDSIITNETMDKIQKTEKLLLEW